MTIRINLNGENILENADNKFYGLRARVEFDLDLLDEDEDVIDIMDRILTLDVKPSRMFITKGRVDIFYQLKRRLLYNLSQDI